MRKEATLIFISLFTQTYELKGIKMNKKDFCSLFLLLLALILVIITLLKKYLYYLEYATWYATRHVEPQFDLFVLLWFVACIFSATLFLIMKKQGKSKFSTWYIVPIIMIVFAHLILSTITYCPECRYGG